MGVSREISIFQYLKKIIKPFDIFKKAITKIFEQLLRHEHIQLQFNHKFTNRR